MLVLLDNADPTTTWLLTAAFGLLLSGTPHPPIEFILHAQSA